MIDESKARVPELDQYVDLMRMRALGEAPEMDSAKQMARVLRDHLPKGQPRYSFMDVGCATGHYLRSIRNAFGTSPVDYVGVDVDTKMVAAARAAWSTDGGGNAKPRFVRAG